MYIICIYMYILYIYAIICNHENLPVITTQICIYIIYNIYIYIYIYIYKLYIYNLYIYIIYICIIYI